jgi:hypothetical protein
MQSGNTHSKIEEQVMASVGVIYAGRKLMSRIAVELYMLVVAAIALWQFTWVHKIVANFAVVERGGLGSIARYLSYAFLHTHVATQLALVVAAAAGIAFCIDAVRSMRTEGRFA